MNEHDKARSAPTTAQWAPSPPSASQPPGPAAVGWQPGSVSAATSTSHPRGSRTVLIRVLLAPPLVFGLLLSGWVLFEQLTHLRSAMRDSDAVVAFLVSLAVATFCVWALRRVVLMSGGVTGEVRAMQSRQETSANSNYIVWSFRLERQDAWGNRLPPVPVEMRARRFKGFVSDGDVVEVRRAWKPGGTLRPRRVRNLTTGAVVKASSLWPLFWGVVVALLVVLAYCSATRR